MSFTLPFTIKTKIVFLSLLFFTVGVFPFSWNGSLNSRLGEGDQLGVRYNYLENFLSLSANAGSLRLQLELAYNQPPEYGYSLIGLRQGLLTYQRNTFTVELGNLSQVFGSGISLNLFEERNIDFNNLPVGIKLDYEQSDRVWWTALVGRKAPFQFYSPSSNSRIPDAEADYWLGAVRGIFSSRNQNLQMTPYLVVSLLSSPIQEFSVDVTSEKIVIDTLMLDVAVSTTGLSTSFSRKNWDLMLDGAWTSKIFSQPHGEQYILVTSTSQGIFTKDMISGTSGYAFYGRFNRYFDAISLMLEYKNYKLGIESANEKTDHFHQATKPLPYQVGPTGLSQHDVSLLGAITHPVDYGDEVGFNLEIRWPLTFEWTVRGQVSVLSSSDDRSITAPITDRLQGRALPTFHANYAPFQEYLIELEYAGENFATREIIAFTQSTLSGLTNETAQYLTVVPAYLTFRLNDNWVLGLVSELQTASIKSMDQNEIEIGGFDFKSAHHIISADYGSNVSVAAIWDYTNDPTQVDEAGQPLENWLSGEVSLRPTRDIQIRASYGAEKGGVRCTGGVCRVVNPFEGTRVTLEVRF